MAGPRFRSSMTYARGRHPNSLAALSKHRNPQPAPKGHRRSLKHGATAEIHIPLDKARQDIFNLLADSAPVRDADGDLPAADIAAVENAARCLARIRSGDEWIAKHGVIGRGGKLRPVVHYIAQETKTLDRLLESLGMNPRSRAALGLDLVRAHDIAQAMSHPDESKRHDLMQAAGVIDE